MKLKFGKIVIKILATLAIVTIVLFFAISPLAKYLIEKNGEKWTGRKITIGKLFINLFTLNLKADDLCIYENKSDSVFLKVGQLKTGISFNELLKGKYYIKPVEISSPRLVVWQKGKKFNFDDLEKRFLAEDTTKKKGAKPEEPLQYKVEGISISNGKILYRDLLAKLSVELRNISFHCPLVASDSPTLTANTDFSLSSGGHFQTSLIVNNQTLTYTLTPKVDSLNIHLLQPWIKDYAKTAFIGGYVSGNLLVKGNFKKPEKISLKGKIGLSHFRFEDESAQNIASWDNLRMSIDSINLAASTYYLGEIRFDKPFILFEMYPKENNFSRLMVTQSNPETSAVSSGNEEYKIDYTNPFTIIRDYVTMISSKYLTSNYKLDNFILQDGHIVYKDYTLEDKFSYDLDQLQLQTGKINSKGDSIHFAVLCLLNGTGHLKAHLSFDPRDFKNMAINYSIQNMKISDFNPYSRFYIAHDFFRGSLFYTSTNTIHNGILESSNLMNIQKIDVSRRTGKGLYALPLRLAVILLRDKNGNIKLDIPVEGNLNDPKYKLGKVIWQVLKNIIVKAAAAPFNLLAKAFGANEKELREIPFDYLQKSLDRKQLKNLDLIEKSLADKPELKVSLIQIANRDNEKELLALFDAKRNYYFDQVLKVPPKDSLSGNELKAINGIANKDSLFNRWLDSKLVTQDVSALPSQLKSRKLIGEKKLDIQEDSLYSQRNRFVLDYLINEKKIDPQRVKIKTETNQDSLKFESPQFSVDIFVDE